MEACSQPISNPVCALPAFLSASFSARTYADTPDQTFVSRTAEIDGVKLHYTTGGHGAALIPAARLRGDVAHVGHPSCLCSARNLR